MDPRKIIKDAFTPSRVGEFPESDEELENKTLTKRLIPRLPWFYASGVSLFIAVVIYFSAFFVLSLIFSIFSSDTAIYRPSGKNLILSFVSLIIAIISQATLPYFIAKNNQLVCVITGWGLAILIFIGAIVFNTFIALK